MKFLLPKDRDGAIAAILKAPDGMQVVIQERKRTRSLEQNDKFHATLHELSRATGYTFEECKDWVKGELGLYDVVEIGGKRRKRYRSSANFSVSEMMDAIDAAERAISFAGG